MSAFSNESLLPRIRDRFVADSPVITGLAAVAIGAVEMSTSPVLAKWFTRTN